MKTKKRLSINFSHREVALSINTSMLSVLNGEPEAADTVTTCHSCDCPWIDIAAAADRDIVAIVDHLRYAFQQVGLHLQISPAGQLQICQNSFQVLKEQF